MTETMDFPELLVCIDNNPSVVVAVAVVIIIVVVIVAYIPWIYLFIYIGGCYPHKGVSQYKKWRERRW